MKTGRFCMVDHQPPKTHGDCVAACIRSLLDRDDVPHVFDDRPVLDSWSVLRSWLAGIGKTIAIFPTDDHESFMRENNPGIPYILFHSTGETDHVVICKDGKKYHDPAWWKVGIVGPTSQGYYVIGIIGDLV